MDFKNIIGKLHLWLGLFSGLIVIVVSITGCIYAFQKEISDLTQPYRFVTAKNESFQPPSKLQAIAEDALPGKHIHAIQYVSQGRAAEVIFYSPAPDAYYYTAYLNPYSGEILKLKNMDTDFFMFILDGHFYLWLPPDIGQPVVASATLVFLIMLVTGIILWWPKNKGAKKQRFSIRWNAKWRRKNYDLHNVLGFYASWIVIILAVTGLVWGFEWFSEGLYNITGGTKSLTYSEPDSDTSHISGSEVTPAIDKAYEKMKVLYPSTDNIEVHPPVTPNSSIAANANPATGTYWQRDFRYFDQYSLEELSVDHVYGRITDATFADKLRRMNYDIHVGAILGLPGKILAFFASLIFASLPVTGFYIWYGRKYKRKTPKRKKRLSVSKTKEVQQKEHVLQ